MLLAREHDFLIKHSSLTVSMMSRITLSLKESARNAKNTAMPVIHSQRTHTEGSPDSVIRDSSMNDQTEKLDSRYLAVGDDAPPKTR